VIHNCATLTEKFLSEGAVAGKLLCGVPQSAMWSNILWVVQQLLTGALKADIRVQVEPAPSAKEQSSHRPHRQAPSGCLPHVDWYKRRPAARPPTHLCPPLTPSLAEEQMGRDYSETLRETMSLQAAE
jgi:hypothetical protein